MSSPPQQPNEIADRLRAEHRHEHREHLAWRADLGRWREELIRAALDYAHRAAPELEMASYEAALDAHEVAIDAHEEMLGRHERMLTAEADGGPITSDEMASFQTEVQDRHRRSRDQHQLLETTHRAILQALRMMGRRPE